MAVGGVGDVSLRYTIGYGLESRQGGRGGAASVPI